jgi:integrase
LAPGEYPKVISERLGHASIAITNDLYSHLVPGMEQAAAAMVDVALEGVISSTEIASLGK